MIGLGANWDRDLYDGDALMRASSGAAASTASRTAFRPAGRTGVSSETSKAAELLQRASEASRLGAIMSLGQVDITPSPFLETSSSAAAAGSCSPMAGVEAAAKSVPAPSRSKFDAFGAAEQPPPEEPALRQLSLCSRLGMHGSLLAVPSRGKNGTHGVRLMRLKPACLVPRTLTATSSSSPALPAGDSGGELPSGVALLESQLAVGFGQDGGAVASGSDGCLKALGPQLGDSSQALLAQYCKHGKEALGEKSGEVFELLDAFFGPGARAEGSRQKRACTKWPPEDSESVRDIARRLSFWLARANARTVEKHLTKVAHAARRLPRFVDLTAPGARSEDTGPRLKAAYHHLTANCVRRALKELSSASAAGSTWDGRQSEHFERLASIVAACGGVSRPCSERRKWLRGQLEEWRAQGVKDLMGPSLWRIYSLLAGDLDEVVGDALEWRTAFGMYLWYRLPTEARRGGSEAKHDDLVESVNDFEAAARRRGANCCFRPVPAHVMLGGSSRTSSSSASSSIAGGLGTKVTQEAKDIQWNTIRTAVGILDWQDLASFDYITYSSKPMDVACSWHFCALLIALLSSEIDASSQAAKQAHSHFLQLTLQYCESLEVAGCWEWAVYVAHFVNDRRARSALVRGLLLRHAPIPRGSVAIGAAAQGLPAEMQQKWPGGGVPAGWLSRAQALRCEVQQDWVGAVVSWLRCGPAHDAKAAERAVVISCAFLLRTLLLSHASAPFQRGSCETIAFQPMGQRGRWLLSVFEALATQLQAQGHGHAWGDVGKEVLQFLRDWASAGAGGHSKKPADVTAIVKRCEAARRCFLGMPW
eukprot:TRINITY_DN90496_c0_g1_i1.p1 TRINITY_DN90496_c0_g1~~TRINITY_DN90496_c0_g1_i1.p1  ORF type:complete len:820 (+),score=163.58 TRINITY_DN90496_c0_g1_i1:85-2544(+)